MTDLQFHPVCLAFSAYDPATYQARLADYREHPERAGETTVLLAEDPADGGWKIADGRHHYLICRELGYGCDFERFAGDRAALVAKVKSRNAHRRHETESQIAAALAALHAWERGGDRHSEGFKGARAPLTTPESGKGARAPLPTQAEVAREAGISRDTVKRAAKVAKLSPELLPAVRDGKLDAKTAAKVADLPAADRKAIVKAADPKAAAKERLGKRAGPKNTKANAGAAFVAGVETLCRDMDQIVARMKALKDDPHAYPMHVDSAVAQVVAARQTLWQGRPSCPCPYCEANEATGCDVCRHTTRVKKAVRASGLAATGGVK